MASLDEVPPPEAPPADFRSLISSLTAGWRDPAQTVQADGAPIPTALRLVDLDVARPEQATTNGGAAERDGCHADRQPAAAAAVAPSR
jgi:hypothetical protein